MEATQTNLLDFLKAPKQLTIPIYQRTYSWTLKQCQRLWDDIINVGQDESVSGHFIGSIVYIKQGLYTVSSIPQLLVIDGQQRLTTVLLLLSALARAIKDQGIKPEITTEKKIKNYFLFNNEEEDDLHYKLILTQNDKDTLIRIFEEKEPPAPASKQILDNFRFFEERISQIKDDLITVYNGIAKLIIVDIALDRERDNPQLIFESLNSTGLELSQADLIRNYVLMDLAPKDQKELYQEYWYPMEQSFGRTNYLYFFDRFMRDYLTVKTGQIPNIKEVYEAFKTYAANDKSGSIEVIVADIYRFSTYFTCIALGRENDPHFKEAFHNINNLKVDVSYPFLLELYQDYSQEAQGYLM